MKGHRRVTLEDVLNDYVASSPEPSYGALEDWVRRYPQYEQELTEFTISWGLMEWLSPSSDTEEVDDETLVLHGMSIVQNLLHQKRQKGSSDEKGRRSVTGPRPDPLFTNSLKCAIVPVTRA